MNRNFFENKIKELSDEKLIALINLRNEANQDISALAIEEAKRRGLEVPSTPPDESKDVHVEDDGREKLEKWNWGAFILAPVWALANNLEKWAILTFIPGINVIVMFYLGFKGNKLAYHKSKLDKVEDFMTVQHKWSIWGVRIFWILLAIAVASFFVEAFD
jgi:hypothetical protein